MPSERPAIRLSAYASRTESVVQLVPRFFVPALTAGGLGLGQARKERDACASWSVISVASGATRLARTDDQLPAPLGSFYYLRTLSIEQWLGMDL